MNTPVIKAIKTFEDVKKALDSFRVWLVNLTSVGKVTLTQPANGATINIADGTTLTTHRDWELVKAHGGLSGQTLDTTAFIEVKIAGVKYKIAVLQ